MKPPGRKKIFHSSAFFSLIWSVFYVLRVFVHFLVDQEYALTEGADRNVIQVLMSFLGVTISLSLFNAYKKDASRFVVVSWLIWMFSNFALSLVLLHVALFEVFSYQEMSTSILINNLLDMVHIFNAPATVYFILVFVTHWSSDRRKNLAFGPKRKKNNQEPIAYQVLHVDNALADEEIVYYV